MIVIGESGAMLKTGYLQRVQGYLANRGVATILYDRIKSNPESGAVDKGAVVARDKKVDFVVGLGGGGTIDSAKGIAFMACNDGFFWDAMGRGREDGRTSPVTSLPIVALPTTAGTGTEANPWTFMTRAGHRGKNGWRNDSLFPHLAIVDPELTHTLPSPITAYTGMGVFFHAVAALLATSSQPASEMLALEAIQIISRFLPSAVKGGTNHNARTMLSWASTAAGMCASLSNGSSHHSLAHALSAYAPQLPYGAGLTLVAEAYFSWLGNARPGRLDLLADAMGRMPEDEPADGSRRFLGALQDLIQSVGLGDESLADYGLRMNDIPVLARNACETVGALSEATPIAQDLSDIETILANAMKDGDMGSDRDQDHGSLSKPDKQRRSSHGT